MNKERLGNSSLFQDKELFLRISKGDETAYAQFFRSYFEPVRSNAFKLLKSEYWVEEIVQEVFLHIWTQRQSLAEVENPVAYLYRITSNRCLNRLRRQQLEAKMQYLIKNSLYIARNNQEENSYDLHKVESLIAAAIQNLPDQQRRIFLLQQENGLTYQQIAEELNISRNTVRNHMVSALKTIRHHLREHGDFLILLFSVWCQFR